MDLLPQNKISDYALHFLLFDGAAVNSEINSYKILKRPCSVGLDWVVAVNLFSYPFRIKAVLKLVDTSKACA